MDIDLNAIRGRFATYEHHHSDPTAFACCTAHASADDVPALLTEIERLRAVAWQLHNGMTDQHAWADHILNDECAGCDKAWQECDSGFACDKYQQWQKAYMDALGLVIGPHPEVA